MKKNKIRNIIYVIIILALISGFTFKIYSYTEDNKYKEQLDTYILDINEFTEISETTFLNTSKSLNGFVYVGRSTCEACRIFIHEFKNIAADNNLDIYYFDSEKNRPNKYFEEIKTKYDIEFVPDLIFIDSDGTFEKFDEENINSNQTFEEWLILKNSLLKRR